MALHPPGFFCSVSARLPCFCSGDDGFWKHFMEQYSLYELVPFFSSSAILLSYILVLKFRLQLALPEEDQDHLYIYTHTHAHTPRGYMVSSIDINEKRQDDCMDDETRAKGDCI